jgi:hypothetical protein
MKQYTNTNLINGLFSGTYYTIWNDPDNIVPGDEDTPKQYEYFKMEDIAQGYQDYKEIILEPLSEISKHIKDINVIGQSSPREYNFSTDCIEFEIDINKKVFKDIQKQLEDDEDFTQYMRDRFTSRDGFMSHTPNNSQEMFEALNDVEHPEHDQSFGACMSYLLYKNRKTDDPYNTIELDIYEEMLGNGYATYEDVEE